MDEWPRMMGPGTIASDDRGPEITDGLVVLGDLTIKRSHFWRRAFSTGLECGQTAEFTFALKVGVSETILKELASSLEISVGALKTTLGSKASVSATTTEEQTVQRKLTISAEKCKSVTRAEWQRIERTTITAARPRWFGLGKPRELSYTIDNPQNLFQPDTCIYPNAGCCPDDFTYIQSQGFNKLYSFKFPQTTVVSLARANDDGTISLPEIEGRWRPGEGIPAQRFRKPYPSSFIDLPDGADMITTEEAGPAAKVLEAAPVRTESDAAGCPAASQLALLASGRAAERELARLREHIQKHNCRRCPLLLDFFRTHAVEDVGAWLSCFSAALPSVQSGPFELSTTVERKQLRMQIASKGADLNVRISTWDPEYAGRDMELFFIGHDTASVRVALVDSGLGMLDGLGRIDSFSKFVDAGEPGTFLLRAVERGRIQRVGEQVGALVRGLKTGSSRTPAPDPVCALTDDEVRQYGAAVLGIVRLVSNSRVLVGLSPSADVHSGDNLEVVRNGSFMGTAVILAIDDDIATCEFHADGNAVAVAGDLIIAASEQ